MPVGMFAGFAGKAAVFRSIFEVSIPEHAEVFARHIDRADCLDAVLDIADALAGDFLEPIAPGLMVEPAAADRTRPRTRRGGRRGRAPQRGGAEHAARARHRIEVEDLDEKLFVLGVDVRDREGEQRIRIGGQS
ncbi:hypothetical protein [Nocardia sp. NPDC052112]|uniref:hypothetical protein n=1 Tax=Nocardia sp. NPDC052112 TaxID=3155646 RepID=UPI00341239CE